MSKELNAKAKEIEMKLLDAGYEPGFTILIRPRPETRYYEMKCGDFLCSVCMDNVDIQVTVIDKDHKEIHRSRCLLEGFMQNATRVNTFRQEFTEHSRKPPFGSIEIARLRDTFEEEGWECTSQDPIILEQVWDNAMRAEIRLDKMNNLFIIEVRAVYLCAYQEEVPLSMWEQSIKRARETWDDLRSKYIVDGS